MNRDNDYSKTMPITSFDDLSQMSGGDPTLGVKTENKIDASQFATVVSSNQSTLPASTNFRVEFNRAKEINAVKEKDHSRDEAIVIPSVGWLVCVVGPDKGKSFRLRFGMNTIGRNNEAGGMIYSVNLNHTIISRSSSVGSIVFDGEEGKFFVRPALEGSRNQNASFRLNDQLVLEAKPLNPYDRIRISTMGNREGTQLIFIPFCGDEFMWEEEMILTRFPAEEPEEIPAETNSDEAHFNRMDSVPAERPGPSGFATCPRGHLYDTSIFSSCPHCKSLEPLQQPEKSSQAATQANNRPQGDDDNFGKTQLF